MIEEIVILSEYGQKIATTEPDANGSHSWFRVEADVIILVDPNKWILQENILKFMYTELFP